VAAGETGPQDDLVGYDHAFDIVDVRASLDA
jgi:hypothetical protein